MNGRQAFCFVWDPTQSKKCEFNQSQIAFCSNKLRHVEGYNCISKYITSNVLLNTIYTHEI